MIGKLTRADIVKYTCMGIAVHVLLKFFCNISVVDVELALLVPLLAYASRQETVFLALEEGYRGQPQAAKWFPKCFRQMISRGGDEKKR